MAGEDMLTFVDLSTPAIDRYPPLLDWVRRSGGGRCGSGSSGRTLQRAAGQRQRQRRRQVWQRRQWQNAAPCGVAAAAAVAATVASAVVAAATVAASMSRPVRPVRVNVFRTGACVGRLKHKTELSFAGRLATLLVLAIICSAGEVLVLEGVLKT